MENIGLRFYKDYYSGLDNDLLFEKRPTKAQEKTISEHFKGKNAHLKSFKIGTFYEQKTTYNSEPLPMQVVGSGLLLGTGNAHRTGSKGEYKLGFFFDHTTGLPILPASSIKGVLRSFFDEKKRGYTLYIIETELKIQGIDEAYLKKLEAHIFDGKDADNKPIMIYKRDVFFDAFPSGTNSQKLFADDVITPHKHPTNPKLNPFADPVPVDFMKIKAGVIFNFKFKLSHFEYNNIEFSADKKRSLFAALLTLGIGAKTNVGYGRLKPLPNS